LHGTSLPKHFIEAKIEVAGRGERRPKQLLVDPKENRGLQELKAEA
jgi:hypothetical protein